MMSTVRNDLLLQLETTCGSLLYELQSIWDEVGESEPEKNKMLLELEQECLEVCKRKVDKANRSRAQIRKEIDDSEAEIAAICSSMGERPVHFRQSGKKHGSLKEELRRIILQLEEMKKRKLERKNQFEDILEQIQKITNEIYGSEFISSKIVVDDRDLSLRKFEELQEQLQTLHLEKVRRLKLVEDHLCTLNSLYLVLGMDSKQTLYKIQAEEDRSITSDSIDKLVSLINNLREVKLQRMQRLQDLATTMLELWNLMDTATEEQRMFQNITSNIAASECEITEANSLSLELINCVEAEVSRLEKLKTTKVKELVLKKWSELEEICRKSRLITEENSPIEYSINSIYSGAVDPALVLQQIEHQISKFKEEAFVRKEILEKVEKWLAACDEESWLEEYNRDENRYNSRRGTHLNLKRAERARCLVNKIPGMVDALTSKTMAWEEERGTEFNYDGVHFLSMLKEYTILRREKEEKQRRRRAQRKVQGQLMAEQEVLYGTKQSPSKAQSQSVKNTPKTPKGSAGVRQVSFGGPMLKTTRPDPRNTAKATPYSRPGRESDKIQQNSNQNEEFDASSVGTSEFDDIANVYEVETPVNREPLSPVSSMFQQQTESQGGGDENIMHFEADLVEENPKAIEYSFEERRAGFVPMVERVNSIIQV